MLGERPVATNFDIENLRLRSTRLHRTHSAKVDTRLSKTDIADMEAKLAALDVHMGYLRSGVEKLADIPERLGTLETKVEHLPSKDFISEKLNGLFVKLGIAATVVGALATVAALFL